MPKCRCLLSMPCLLGFRGVPLKEGKGAPGDGTHSSFKPQQSVSVIDAVRTLLVTPMGYSSAAASANALQRLELWRGL